jgi:hypothetical protein
MFKYQHINISNIITELETGDLILFSSYNFNLFNRVFSNLRFSHVGMVINENNNLFSIELMENDYVYPNSKQYPNVNIFNLIDRITHYPGFVYICKYNSKISELQKNDIYNFINISDIKYSPFYDNAKKIILNKNITNSKHCVEFISLLLQKMKIYNFSNIHKINLMHELVKICNGKIYSEPIRVIVKQNNLNEYKQLYKNYC